jgi:hypothetical protein
MQLVVDCYGYVIDTLSSIPDQANILNNSQKEEELAYLKRRAKDPVINQKNLQGAIAIAPESFFLLNRVTLLLVVTPISLAIQIYAQEISYKQEKD